MSLIELLVFLAMIALGVLLARTLYPHGIRLAIFGFLGGVAFIPCIITAYFRYRRWLYVGDEDMPDCFCGNSTFRYEKVGAEYHLLCQQCRTRYEQRRGDVWVF